jgi:hypothetical protein
MADAGGPRSDTPADTTDPTGQLAEVTSQVSRQWQEEHSDGEAMVQAIVATAVRVVPHAGECSISYVIGRSGPSRARRPATCPGRSTPRRGASGKGCAWAVWEQEVVRVYDVAVDVAVEDAGRTSHGRRRSWAPAARRDPNCPPPATSPVRSAPYSRTPRAFVEESQDMG